MAENGDLHRVIGQLEGRVSSLESMFQREQLHTREWQARMEGKIDRLHETLTAAKGGFRALGLSGRALATIASLLALAGGFLLAMLKAALENA